MSKLSASGIKLLALLFVLAGALIGAVNSAQSQILILFDKPCRALDTRTFSDPIAANEIRVFQLDPLQSAPFHGGVANCGVPTTVTSVKLIVTGSPRLTNGGYFRVFNASESVTGTFSSVQLQTQGSWSAVQLDIPLDGNIWVAIHSTVSAHALVDVVGYYE